MLLHELSGFPVHQFALGPVGAALCLGRFRGQLLEVSVRIERGLGPGRRVSNRFRGRRSIIQMLERPFQNAMNDEVGISPNGRSEMGVCVEAESEMAEWLGGVTGLLQGTQHEVGDDAFFWLADNFSNQALIMLRRDAQVAARERHLHAAFAAMTVGVRPPGFRWCRNAAMANGDLALVQVFDAKGVSEGARQFFELEDFARVGLLMNAMERFDAALQ